MGRFRARIGASKQFGDFTAGLRLATGSDNNPLSENQTFTSEFATKWIGVDQAFITWTPSFSMGHLKVTAGKMANPLTTTPISWDPDPQPEGLLVEGSLDDAKLRATYFVLNGSSAIVVGSTNEDLYMAWISKPNKISRSTTIHCGSLDVGLRICSCECDRFGRCGRPWLLAKFQATWRAALIKTVTLRWEWCTQNGTVTGLFRTSTRLK